MKINYNQTMEEEICKLCGLTSLEEKRSFGKKPRLLLHCCCAPCSSAVIERISKYFDITYLYYNPNIYPLEEYKLRAEEFKKLNIDIVEIPYDHERFLTLSKGREKDEEGGFRCRICIAERIDFAFRYARENAFDCVTTTLSISPHKDAEFINITGENLENKYGIKYLHSDFKKQNGYLRSIQISKDKNIYRQEYCGCEFSFDNKK